MTDEFDFEGQPNVPPVILSKPGEPQIGSNVWIDSSMQPQWEVHVQVRDENLEQTLEAHWRVVHQRDMEPEFRSAPLAGPASGPVRDLDFFIETAVLQFYECHRLELVVSGSFIPDLTEPRFFDFVLPEDQNDVAFASWEIWEGEGPATTPDAKLKIFNTCKAIEDLRATEMSTGGAQ